MMMPACNNIPIGTEIPSAFQLIFANEAPYLTREFRGHFAELDVMQLPNYNIYIRL